MPGFHALFYFPTLLDRGGFVSDVKCRVRSPRGRFLHMQQEKFIALPPLQLRTCPSLPSPGCFQGDISDELPSDEAWR